MIIISNSPLLVDKDPDTTGWGVKETGTMWYNTTEKRLKCWNGTRIDRIARPGTYYISVSEAKSLMGYPFPNEVECAYCKRIIDSNDGNWETENEETFRAYCNRCFIARII